MAKMTFEIDDDKHAEFKAAAARRRVTVKQVLNECVDHFLRGSDAPVPQPDRTAEDRSSYHA